MYLLEDKGEVALYRNDNNEIIANYNNNSLKLLFGKSLKSDFSKVKFFEEARKKHIVL